MFPLEVWSLISRSKRASAMVECCWDYWSLCWRGSTVVLVLGVDSRFMCWKMSIISTQHRQTSRDSGRQGGQAATRLPRGLGLASSDYSPAWDSFAQRGITTT